MAQATAAGGTPLSPDAFVCRPLSPSIASADSAGSPFTDGIMSSPIADVSSLSAISGCLLSLIARGGLLFNVLSCFLSAILGCFLSFIAGNGPFFTVFSSGLLSLVFPAGF